MHDGLKETIENLPHTPGVYIFRNEKKVPLYVGKSVDLRARVRSYFQDDVLLPPKTKQLVKEIDSIEVIETESEIEALLLEAALIQSIKPNFNQALKDDKRYIHIEVTDSYYKRVSTNLNVRSKDKQRVIYHTENAYPTINTARKTNNATSIYFGPFPEASTVKKVLKQLRKTFGWCKYQTIGEVKKAAKPCFYFHLGQCPGFCAGEITEEDYIKHMDRIIQFLRGDRKELMAQLTTEMQDASDRLDFEEARVIRDQIDRIEYITQKFRLPSNYLKDPSLESEQYYFARQQLREVVGEIRVQWAPWLRNLERIEAYDISNTQGSEPTGSMVVLIDGVPHNELYRMFKIKNVDGINDPAMIREVIHRRIAYLSGRTKKKDESFSQVPQLLLIDGGKTQVNAARIELANAGLDIPVIGLAKKEEQLIIPLENNSRFETITLPKDSPSLHLMQKIRDEAHRFAKNYHITLRSKSAMS